jgi:hypothetical protein
MFKRSGHNTYTRFNEFDNAINFAEHMAKRHNSNVEVRNYDTEELIYAVDAKTDLDNKLRI